jgi:hypothetical protein
MVGRVGFGLVGFDTIVLADWLAWLVGRLLAGFNRSTGIENLYSSKRYMYTKKIVLEA